MIFPAQYELIRMILPLFTERGLLPATTAGAYLGAQGSLAHRAFREEASRAKGSLPKDVSPHEDTTKKVNMHPSLREKGEHRRRPQT